MSAPWLAEGFASRACAVRRREDMNTAVVDQLTCLGAFLNVACQYAIKEPRPTTNRSPADSNGRYLDESDVDSELFQGRGGGKRGGTAGAASSRRS